MPSHLEHTHPSRLFFDLKSPLILPSFRYLRMSLMWILGIGLSLSVCFAEEFSHPAPSHLMVGPGLFDVDRKRPRALIQVEYRWDVHCHQLRPLATFSISTDQNFFLGGGLAYDFFLKKKVVITPSFAPGIYCQGYGKNLGFPLNFRSALEVCFVLGNQGRIGAQFSHISNAHMFYRNPGANTLFLFYAIPFPHKKASGK